MLEGEGWGVVHHLRNITRVKLVFAELGVISDRTNAIEGARISGQSRGEAKPVY